MYDEIAEKAFSMDKFILPIHGIENPQFENPMNLFKR
jgi:hypothetical protein